MTVICLQLVCFYVLPIYELRSDTEPFRTKQELITAVENKNARALMQETCWFCQKPTDYERWLALKHENSLGGGGAGDVSDENDPIYEIDVAFSVPYAKSWEPFVIGRRDMPFYSGFQSLVSCFTFVSQALFMK